MKQIRKLLCFVLVTLSVTSIAVPQRTILLKRTIRRSIIHRPRTRRSMVRYIIMAAPIL